MMNSQDEMLRELQNMINEYDTSDIYIDEQQNITENDDDEVLSRVDNEFGDDIETADEELGGHTGTKEYLFKAERPEHIEKLQVDDVAEFSVSDSIVAKQMTELITKDLKDVLEANEVVICDWYVLCWW